MNIAWILCETCMKLNAHFIHKKTSSENHVDENSELWTPRFWPISCMCSIRMFQVAFELYHKYLALIALDKFTYTLFVAICCDLGVKSIIITFMLLPS